MTDNKITQGTPQEIPLPPAPALPFEMKANFSEYRRRLGVVRIVLAIGLSLLIWFRYGFVPWLISASIIAMTIIVVLTLLHRRRLKATNKGLEFYTSFGRRKEMTWEEIDTVHVFANYLDQGFGVMPRVVVSHKSGGSFVSLVSLYWNIDDMNLLLSLFEKRKVNKLWYADPATSVAIAKNLPTLVPYYERHPFLLAIWIVLGLIVAITIFVALTT